MSSFSKGMRIGKYIIKYFFVLLIIAINVTLIWRMTSSSDPKSMKTISPNEAILAEYKKSGKELYMFTQEQLKHTYAEYNYGYFAVTQTVFIPDANQAQIVFRYNNSTIKAVADDYNLPEVPSRDTELFDVTLLFAVDLTPENSDDNAISDGEGVRFVRFAASYSESEKKNLYNYRKLVFDFGDTDIKSLLESNSLLAVYADIFYIGEVDYSSRPYGTLCLYDYKSENIPLTLKGRDISAIRKYEEDLSDGK